MTAGTAPSGKVATIRRVGDAFPVTVPVMDGAVDPVQVAAQTGDSIDVVVFDIGGQTVLQMRVGVTSARPPVVVRTDPPRKKTDVPVNAALVVVFSEPVAAASLNTASVQLRVGQSVVSGAVRFLDSTLDATHVTAEFVPDAPLSANTEYSLIVTQDVRDLDGDALAARDTTTFSTGTSSTGAPASVEVSPVEVSPVDSGMQMRAGTTRQLRATVRDAAGNVLTDSSVTWSSNKPDTVSVSATGLLTAVTVGRAVITASVNASVKAVLPVKSIPGPATSVTIVPSTATVAAGDTVILTAMAHDANGFQTYVYWSSSATSVATVNYLGMVIGVSQGSATITAARDSAKDTALVTVTPPVPVASVSVTPAADTLVVGGSVQLSATDRDATNRVIDRPNTWTTDNDGVATVDGSGKVTAVSPGVTTVTATSEGVSGHADITVITLTFNSVTVGWGHACGLTTAGAGYCWGDNYSGQLGTGGSPASSLFPTPITGALTFTALSAGVAHTCGLTASGAIYCWGYNDHGELGDATRTPRASPTLVVGGLTFAAVSAGRFHTCGLTTGGAAYCWGVGDHGQRGDNMGVVSDTPVAVLGGLTFTALSAGGAHTCGLTASGEAYCWGDNLVGQLGDGTGTDAGSPVAVVGGLMFAALKSGETHTCGVTTTGALYCWGDNMAGQLGDGTTTNRPSPVVVLGGAGFATVSAGSSYSCGVTTAGAGYCWGANNLGQLGDGTQTFQESPVAVLGGLTFASVSTGWQAATCGLSTGGVAYCWGDNQFGGLGNGTTTNSSVPVKVLGQP